MPGALVWLYGTSSWTSCKTRPVAAERRPPDHDADGLLLWSEDAAGLVFWSRACLPLATACRFRAALDANFLCSWSRSNSLTSSISRQLKVGSGGLEAIPAGREPGLASGRCAGNAGVKAGTGVVRSCLGFT